MPSKDAMARSSGTRRPRSAAAREHSESLLVTGDEHRRWWTDSAQKTEAGRVPGVPVDERSDHRASRPRQPGSVNRFGPAALALGGRMEGRPAGDARHTSVTVTGEVGGDVPGAPEIVHENRRGAQSGDGAVEHGHRHAAAVEVLDRGVVEADGDNQQPVDAPVEQVLDKALFADCVNRTVGQQDRVALLGGGRLDGA